VAGIEDDEVGIVGGVGLGIAAASQRFHHALAVIDVHLTAVSLNENSLEQ
jgi:hypothetical protein